LIEDRDHDAALRELEQVILTAPESAVAFYLKTLVEFNAKSYTAISCDDLRNNESFAKALHYASPDERAAWELLLLTAEEREKEQDYRNTLKNVIDSFAERQRKPISLSKIKAYQNTLTELKLFGDYKDAEQISSSLLSPVAVDDVNICCPVCITKNRKNRTTCSFCGFSIQRDAIQSAELEGALVAAIRGAVLTMDVSELTASIKSQISSVIPSAVQYSPTESYATSVPPPDAKEVRRWLNFCGALSMFRFLDVLIWIVIMIVERSGSASQGFGVVWNFVAIAISVGLAIDLLPKGSPPDTDEERRLSKDAAVNRIMVNAGYSLIGLIWYGIQLVMLEKELLFIAIFIEVVIIAVSISAFISNNLSSRKAL